MNFIFIVYLLLRLGCTILTSLFYVTGECYRFLQRGWALLWALSSEKKKLFPPIPSCSLSLEVKICNSLAKFPLICISKNNPQICTQALYEMYWPRENVAYIDLSNSRMKHRQRKAVWFDQLLWITKEPGSTRWISLSIFSLTFRKQELCWKVQS